MSDRAALQQRAVQGDAQARVQLAYALLTGDGVQRSIPDALELVQAACAQGNSNAMMLYAALTARGVGRPKALNEAYDWIRRAAALGHAHAQTQLAILGQAEFDSEPWLKPIKLEQLASEPRIALVTSFLPPSVCAWIIKSSASKLRPCEVFDPNGGTKRDPSRSNTATAFHLLEGDLIQQLVCRRIAVVSGLPLEHQERMNILHYDPGQEFKPHYDFIRPWGPEAQGYAGEIAALGQRAVTMLVYLNEGYEGGETVFPHLKLGIKGRTGDALIFWNVSATGVLERNSLHAGAPVISGEKWLLSQWVREKPHPLI